MYPQWVSMGVVSYKINTLNYEMNKKLVLWPAMGIITLIVKIFSAVTHNYNHKASTVTMEVFVIY